SSRLCSSLKAAMRMPGSSPGRSATGLAAGGLSLTLRYTNRSTRPYALSARPGTRRFRAASSTSWQHPAPLLYSSAMDLPCRQVSLINQRSKDKERCEEQVEILVRYCLVAMKVPVFVAYPIGEFESGSFVIIATVPIIRSLPCLVPRSTIVAGPL